MGEDVLQQLASRGSWCKLPFLLNRQVRVSWLSMRLRCVGDGDPIAYTCLG